ncbi:MAG: hypothetical protein V4547_18985 [Bacteroidota bacterium]
MATYSNQSDTGFITARAGGTQLLAKQITKKNTIISVCATAGDSVRFQPLAPGDPRTLHHQGVARCDVYPPIGWNFFGKAINAPLPMLKPTKITVMNYAGENKVLRYN